MGPNETAPVCEFSEIVGPQYRLQNAVTLIYRDPPTTRDPDFLATSTSPWCGNGSLGNFPRVWSRMNLRIRLSKDLAEADSQPPNQTATAKLAVTQVNGKGLDAGFSVIV